MVRLHRAARLAAGAPRAWPAGPSPQIGPQGLISHGATAPRAATIVEAAAVRMMCGMQNLGPPPLLRIAIRRRAAPLLQIGASSPIIPGRCGLIAPQHHLMGAPLAVHLGSAHFAAVRIYSSQQRPPPAGGPRGRLVSALGTLGAGGMLLMGKGKYLLGALKLTKFASLGSMLLTVGAYTAFYGLPYAVGMTGLILVHESGHALVMKKLGIPFSPMVFVPFMGAAVAMRKRPKDAYEEALVAFGGPVLGSAGALGVAAAAHSMNSPLLFALADFGFMINLFNMIPLGMMDGGRICGAVSPYAGLVGLGLGGTMAYQGMISNPIFYLILLGGGYETFMRFYDPVGHAPANYYKITGGQRAAITGGYFGLAGALFLAMSLNRQYMMTPEQLQRQQLERDYYRRYD